MSLINDALRRAKQAHKERSAASAPVPNLRPVDPPTPKGGNTLLVPVALFVVAVLSLGVLWQVSKHDGSAAQPKEHLTVAAKTLPAAESMPAAVEPAAQPTSGSSTEIPKSSSVNVPSTSAVPDHAGRAASAPANGSTNLMLATSESADTNHIAATEPPAPPPLKLQSIVYNPRRPSAMINGRVMFVGDRIRDLRVMAIHSSDVVLVSSTRTNLLSLEP